MINIPELRVFVMAAEELNFSRAAERLHLSQSAVSQNIQAIERLYRTELFVRHGRSVQLSDVGLKILPMAREVLNTTHILEDTLSNVNGEISGDLTIACATTSGRYFIPSLLASFQQEFPHVRTRLSLMSRQKVLDELLTQTLNLGVVGRYTEHRELECQLMLEDRIILIVPPNHPWSRVEKVKLEDVMEQPFITREINSGTFELLYDSVRQVGLNPKNFKVIMQLGNAEAVEMAVENGIGVTFISEMMAARSLALGRVKQVLVEDFNVTQQVYLVRHISRNFIQAEEKLWNYVSLHNDLAANLMLSLSDVSHSGAF